MLSKIAIGYLVIVAASYGLSLMETYEPAGLFILGSLLVIATGFIVNASKR